MKNNCQEDYEHAVLKTKEDVGERISLTTRAAIAIQFILTIPLDSGLNPSGKPVEQG